MIIDLLQTKAQARQAKYALEVAKINAEITKLGEEEQPTDTRVIGFQTPSPILVEEEDDFDDDDV